jgi:hypothetical protein
MPSTLKNMLAMIAQGFFLGIGLCFVFFLYQRIQFSAYEGGSDLPDSYAEMMADKSVSEKDYVLSDLVKNDEDGKVWIVGKFKNTSTRPLNGIELQANLYQGEKFVDQYSEMLTGTIRPGDSRLFKISCGCQNKPPAAHDSFKVVAIGGY